MILRTLLLALTFLTALPVTQAIAFDRGRHSDDDDRKRDEKPKREMSLDQAVQMVQRRYDARVISTDVKRSGDRTIYRLKLLNKDGKVWSVTVDATTGSIG